MWKNNPDMSCERACMDTEDNESFTDILDTLNRYQDSHGQRFPSKNIKEAALRVMDEEEEETEISIYQYLFVSSAYRATLKFPNVVTFILFTIIFYSTFSSFDAVISSSISFLS